ncbi:MAG: sensor histidine kinase, partial [Bacteroidales bacterium]
KKLAERTIHLARHQQEYSNIAINVHIEPDELILYADENLITHVVLNLLRNAMQAIGEDNPDGTIEFKAYCNDKESVIIEISNNGPAITSEIVQHIFVPFFTTKEGGSGIGLSISRQIMRLSGGSLSLKNTPGTQPTTFMLIFP